MPPTLKCLNVLKAIRRPEAFSKALFSSSSNSQADRASTPTSDLLSIFDPKPSQLPIRLTPSNFARGPSSSRPSNKLPPRTANESVLRLINKVDQRAARRAETARTSLSAADVEKHQLARDLTRQISRRWKAGDIYAPHDLSPIEMSKWKKRKRPQFDAFDLLGMNPTDMYKNFSIMSEYMSPVGRIKPSRETGLRPVNQRKVARAIKRSIGLGLMPSVHRHPEILQKEAVRRNDFMTRMQGSSSRSRS